MDKLIDKTVNNLIYLEKHDINIIDILDKHKKILYEFIIKYLDENENKDNNEKTINVLYNGYLIYCSKNIIKSLNIQTYNSLLLNLFSNNSIYNLSKEYIIFDNIIYKRSYLLYSVD